MFPNALLLILDLPNIDAARTKPIATPRDSHGWLLQNLRIERKKPVKVLVVDLGTSCGGFLVTLERVSRIEKREARMGSPVTVTSQ